MCSSGWVGAVELRRDWRPFVKFSRTGKAADSVFEGKVKDMSQLGPYVASPKVHMNELKAAGTPLVCPQSGEVVSQVVAPKDEDTRSRLVRPSR